MLFKKEMSNRLRQWLKCELGLHKAVELNIHKHRQWAVFWDFAVERIRTKDGLEKIRACLQQYKELRGEKEADEAKKILRERLLQREQKENVKRKEEGNTKREKISQNVQRKKENKRIDEMNAVSVLIRKETDALEIIIQKNIKAFQRILREKITLDKEEMAILADRLSKADGEDPASIDRLLDVEGAVLFSFIQKKISEYAPNHISFEEGPSRDELIYRIYREINRAQRGELKIENAEFVCHGLTKEGFEERLKAFASEGAVDEKENISIVTAIDSIRRCIEHAKTLAIFVNKRRREDDGYVKKAIIAIKERKEALFNENKKMKEILACYGQEIKIEEMDNKDLTAWFEEKQEQISKAKKDKRKRAELIQEEVLGSIFSKEEEAVSKALEVLEKRLSVNVEDERKMLAEAQQICREGLKCHREICALDVSLYRMTLEKPNGK
eukprot:GHVN01088578.1.p1 GENE.GHVN01088578.1~~GHVN01088578.1.p1  ORF type:complete len:443 (+),score=83.85 GHVN01088578.1:31-1359(+)